MEKDSWISLFIILSLLSGLDVNRSISGNIRNTSLKDLSCFFSWWFTEYELYFQDYIKDLTWSNTEEHCDDFKSLSTDPLWTLDSDTKSRWEKHQTEEDVTLQLNMLVNIHLDCRLVIYRLIANKLIVLMKCHELDLSSCTSKIKMLQVCTEKLKTEITNFINSSHCCIYFL